MLFNLLNNRLMTSGYAVTRPLELVALALLARWFGLSLDDVGLARTTWTRGLRWAAAALGIVAVAYSIALAIPWTREAFLDRRGDLTIGLPLAEAVVATFVGTVLLEEFAFRGVLWGLVNRLRGPAAATVLSSILFGLWHVLPSRRLHLNNTAVGDVLGREPGTAVLVVALGVLGTALAGALLCELRRRSGSLLAPIGLHLGTNCLGYVFSALVWASS